MQKAPSQAALSAKKPKAPALAKGDVDRELERLLLTACADGEVDKVRQVADKIHRTQEATRADALDELFGCAFARAAGANQVPVMALLLALGSAFPMLASCVAAVQFGICRLERYFPAVESELRGCFALRYVGYAAVVCVERNAVGAMRFLLERALLDDGEVLRCFELAKRKAACFDAPNPGAYRPMLMLLINAFPSLLDVCRRQRDAAVAPPALTQESALHLRALEASLAYEFQLNRSASST
ncbi:hypothetical protein PybrP1_009989 [[Pythium] brassicae (nom. inval.)]|nr:hypothetical protein PybrP1_009989 [[Pythium] brassicae (nom. inval.)]